MSLQNVVVIWVDGTFEGNNYQSMKDEFNENIVSSPSQSSSNPIDDLICNQTKEVLIINGAPVITVQTEDQALEQIRNNSTAKIFFISSGRLGRDIVPKIVQQYPQVHSFYIFCFKISKHLDWALEYINCLQMFDHQIDLLVRLMRDIANYFTKQGQAFLAIDDQSTASIYFKHAENIEARANEKNK